MDLSKNDINSNTALKLLTDCINYTVKKTPVDTIYFNFSKGFDTVPTGSFRKKKQAMYTSDVLEWLRSYTYLTDRIQLVKVNGVPLYSLQC